jgi:hypothetical protein
MGQMRKFINILRKHCVIKIDKNFSLSSKSLSEYNSAADPFRLASDIWAKKKLIHDSLTLELHANFLDETSSLTSSSGKVNCIINKNFAHPQRRYLTPANLHNCANLEKFINKIHVRWDAHIVNIFFTNESKGDVIDGDSFYLLLNMCRVGCRRL